MPRELELGAVGGRQRRAAGERGAVATGCVKQRCPVERRLVIASERRAIRVAPSLRFGASALLAVTIACESGGSSPGSAALASGVDARPPDSLQALRDFESTRRAATDFSAPSAAEALGPDPYSIRCVPGSSHFVGILRGPSAVVELDDQLHEVRRLAAPASTSAVAVAADGEIFVAGELSPVVARYRLAAKTAVRPAEGTLARVGEIDLDLESPDKRSRLPVRAVRDLAVGREGVLYAVEEHEGRLLTVDLASHAVSETLAGQGPIRVVRTRAHIVVDCLLDHAIVVYPVDARGYPAEESQARVRHEGPIWSIDALETRTGDLVVAAGGVEDHPLDRTGGFFGYVDSFFFLYVARSGTPTRTSVVNLSEYAVITPKAVALEEDDAGVLTATVTGYGGDHMALLRFSDGPGAPPAIASRVLPPGTSAFATTASGDLVVANPLLDAWIRTSSNAAGWEATDVPAAAVECARAPCPSSAPRPGRSDASKLGEALLSTTLIAPWNRSDGALSRFTCETCHFEGYVDGRTHATGRADVRATTKPLFGLFNNRPYFSRALDPDLASVANNEFRVAGAHSDHDPWFSIATTDVPWLAPMRLEKTDFSAEDLRRALMAFLMDLAPRPNPSSLGRAQFTADERRGALAFRATCERCHAARLVSDDPATEVPFEQWEERVLSAEGPIVWGSPEYRMTGIVPYVHQRGARTPSLRRLFKKRPYFTNGSARDLPSLLARVRLPGDEFLHDAVGVQDTCSPALDAETRRVLLAFLELL